MSTFSGRVCILSNNLIDTDEGILNYYETLYCSTFFVDVISFVLVFCRFNVAFER